MEYSDFDLINGIKNGDKDALSMLVRRWYPQIFRYCCKVIGNEQDAYDITQDVFVSVLQNIERFHIWNKFVGFLQSRITSVWIILECEKRLILHKKRKLDSARRHQYWKIKLLFQIQWKRRFYSCQKCSKT